MNFCSECGHSVSLKVPEGDHLPRYVCDQCDTIHYQNPRIINCVIPIAPDGRILLCRRNIEPKLNMWTLPGGFMENGESTVEGALRETWEESRVKPINPELVAIISLPQWNQVHIFYRAEMTDFQYETTPESNAIELFELDQLPWEELAFRTVKRALEHFIQIQDQPLTVLNDEIRF